jgi:hypothetical protein
MKPGMSVALSDGNAILTANPMAGLRLEAADWRMCLGGGLWAVGEVPGRKSSCQGHPDRLMQQTRARQLLDTL